MSGLYYIVIFIFVLICLSLVGIILLQSSKTGGMGAGIAGNSALNSAFGSQGADKLLVKITTVLATLFMVLSIILNVLYMPSAVDLRCSGWVNRINLTEAKKPLVQNPIKKERRLINIFDEHPRLLNQFMIGALLGDGWENAKVHNDPDDLREQALKMGANIIIYSMVQ